MKRMRLTAALAAGAVAAMGLALTTHAQMGGKSEGHAHAKLGKAAPDFTLVDTNGKEHTLSDYTKDGKVVVLEWFNSGCPFVVRHHKTHPTMKDTSAKFADRGVVWLAINSGAPGKQGHGKDKEAIENWNLQYPVLNDESGKVGHMYGAKTTPHMYIIDKNGMLVFNGAIDNDRGDEMPYASKTNYVAKALGELLAGTEISEPDPRPYGCSVKYAN